MIDWSKVSDNEEVIVLLKKRKEIENQIKEIDKNSLFKFQLELFKNGEN